MNGITLGTAAKPSLTVQSGGLRLLGGWFIAPVLLFVSGCQEQHELTRAGDLTGVLATKDALGHAGDDSTKGKVVRPKISSSGPWPKAVAAETDYRFGRMRLNGPNRKRDFTITNQGDAPLELVTGKATCQCTTFKLDRTEVEPGETATLTIEWQAKQESASFSHGGNVYTNDPENDTIHYSVTGIIESSIITKPESPWFAGNIVGQKSASFEATVFTRVIPDLTIESVSSTTEFTTTEHHPMSTLELNRLDAVCGWKLKVEVRPGFPVGRFEDMLTIVYGDNGADDTQIRVAANRFGAVRFSPVRGTRFNEKEMVIALGQFPAAKGRKAQLMLVVNQEDSDEELKLLEVESDPRSLRVSLEPIGNLRGVTARYRLTIAVPPGGMKLQRPRGKAGEIRCRTNHPTFDEFKLLVTFNSF